MTLLQAYSNFNKHTQEKTEHSGRPAGAVRGQRNRSRQLKGFGSSEITEGVDRLLEEHEIMSPSSFNS